MKKTNSRPLAAGMLAVALLFAATNASAEEPPDCEPSVWGWVATKVSGLLGHRLPPRFRPKLGDECGDGFW